MPVGRLGRVYVWSGSAWKDIGITRNITVSTENQLTERDAFGRAMPLTSDITLEAILMQSDEATIRNVLDETNYVDVFVSNKPNPTLPANPSASTTEGIILRSCSLSVEATIDMGGGETATTIRLRTRDFPGNIIQRLG